MDGEVRGKAGGGVVFLTAKHAESAKECGLAGGCREDLPQRTQRGATECDRFGAATPENGQL